MYTAKTIRSWNFDTPDLEASVKFWCNLLGAEERTRHQVRGVDVVRLNLGGFGVGLFDGSAGENEGVPHHTIGIDGPDDPEELKAEIEAQGIEVVQFRPHREGQNGYSLYVNDPAGNRIELSVGEG